MRVSPWRGGRVLRGLPLVAFLAVALSVGPGVATATTPTSPARYSYDRVSSLAQATYRDALAAAGRLPARSRIDERLPAHPTRFLAAEAGTSLVRYDADFALSQLTRGGSAKASELVDFAESQGWTRAQRATGPVKYVDKNGVTRLTIRSGSPRAPGSNFPHVEMRNTAGQRVDPYGNAVARRSPGNHTPIEWDLP